MLRSIFAALSLVASSAIAADIRDCADCPALRLIPAGSFMMGAEAAETSREKLSAESAARERPMHRVAIARPFYMAAHETTVAAYRAFAEATLRDVDSGCIAAYDRATDAWRHDPARSWRDPGFPQGADHPVLCVSWHDAVAMADWLSARTGHRYRLPTEAEWEYAARAGTATARYWGDARDGACDHANVGDASAAAHYGWPADPERAFACDDEFIQTAPGGRFPANGFGLHDMLGNAWEWVTDCFHPTYDGAPTDGSAWVEPGCDRRVERGGGWSGRPNLVRAAARGGTPPEGRSRHIGFRLVREIE
jgi:formylglycine-generating enzyme required for sulfatase activity